MGKNNFYRDETEIFQRCWWLLVKTCETAKSLSPASLFGRWLTDEDIERERTMFVDYMAYSISFVMHKLADDIEESHDWEEKGGYDLHITYRVCFAKAFEEVFGLPEDKDFFLDLIRSYWTPHYDEDYAEFWNIPQLPEITEEDMNKTLGEFLRDTEVRDEDYSIHKYCVFRIGKIVRISDPEKFLDYIKETYSNIGLSYYDDAFFGFSKKKIIRELRKAYHKR